MFKVYKVDAAHGADGREIRTMGVYSTPELAETNRVKAGAYGEDGWVTVIDVIEPGDKPEDLTRAKAIASARQKLSPDEFAALNLE